MSCKQPTYESLNWFISRNKEEFFDNPENKRDREGMLRYNDQRALLDAKFDKVNLEDVKSYKKEKGVELYYHDFTTNSSGNIDSPIYANIKNVGYYVTTGKYNSIGKKYVNTETRYEFTNFHGEHYFDRNNQFITKQYISSVDQDITPNDQFYKLKDGCNKLTHADQKVMKSLMNYGGKRRKTRRRNRKSKKTRKSRKNRRKSRKNRRSRR
jgi:hypothetical protein